MNNKFSNIPIDNDTKIFFESKIKCDNYDVFYQKWFWEGITAESIIFDSNDIVGMDDNKITKIVRTSNKVNPESTITIKWSETGYTFVNFNFEYD